MIFSQPNSASSASAGYAQAKGSVTQGSASSRMLFQQTPLRASFFLACLLVFSFILQTGGNNQNEILESPRPIAKLMHMEGPIGPAITDYFKRALKVAENAEAAVLIVRLDTPGGLLDSTREIVRHILESPVPVAVYVAPEGAGAGSAGVFITMSAHVAAMAPATTIGAATPVRMGGGGQEDSRDSDAEGISAQERKLINFVESYIEGIAHRRDRNAEWARESVRKAKTASTREAFELNVIDIVAVDIADLLDQMHGLEIDDFVLDTRNAVVEVIPMTLREQALRFLFNPQVMLVLMLITVYGIMGELSSPGAVFPGTLGVISLILLLYATAAMPVNIAGYALIVVALILMIIEAFTPVFGLLTAAGAVSFAMGAFMLFEEFTPGAWAAWAYILPATILTVLFFSVIVSAGLRAQLGKARSGVESFAGQHAEAISKVSSAGGKVIFMGEIWNAVTENGSEIEKGQPCEIIASQGLLLKVKPLIGED